MISNSFPGCIALLYVAHITERFQITIVVYSLAMLQLTAAVHVLRYLLLISTGTVLVYRYRRSIAQVCACERPTGYLKYESLYDSESNT